MTVIGFLGHSDDREFESLRDREKDVKEESRGTAKSMVPHDSEYIYMECLLVTLMSYHCICNMLFY